MEPYKRGRSYGKYYGVKPMRISPRYNAFGGATASGRAAYRARAARRGVVARRARAMLNRRTAGFLGIEKKFYDTALAGAALATTTTGGEFDPSATSMISTPAQGDSEQNRDGKRIVIKSVMLNGVINCAAQTAQTVIAEPTQVFVALVLDMQTNGAQLNSEDVFKNTSGATLLGGSVQRNLLFSTRFRVLKEWSMYFAPQAAVNNASATTVSFTGGSQCFDCFLPLDLNVNFNSGTTASVANVIDNSLHVVAFTNSTSMAPTISYNARIRFMG